MLRTALVGATDRPVGVHGAGLIFGPPLSANHEESFSIAQFKLLVTGESRGLREMCCRIDA